MMLSTAHRQAVAGAGRYSSGVGTTALFAKDRKQIKDFPYSLRVDLTRSIHMAPAAPECGTWVLKSQGWTGVNVQIYLLRNL